jgi:hypothetical protein
MWDLIGWGRIDVKAPCPCVWQQVDRHTHGYYVYTRRGGGGGGGRNTQHTAAGFDTVRSRSDDGARDRPQSIESNPPPCHRSHRSIPRRPAAPSGLHGSTLPCQRQRRHVPGLGLLGDDSRLAPSCSRRRFALLHDLVQSFMPRKGGRKIQATGLQPAEKWALEYGQRFTYIPVLPLFRRHRSSGEIGGLEQAGQGMGRVSHVVDAWACDSGFQTHF